MLSEHTPPKGCFLMLANHLTLLHVEVNVGKNPLRDDPQPVSSRHLGPAPKPYLPMPDFCPVDSAFNCL